MYLFIQLYLYNLCYVYILSWYAQENMFCNTYLTKFMFIRILLIHDPFGSFHLIIAQTHFVLLYFTLLCFTNIAFEGLRQPWVEQVYQCHFSDIICSLHCLCYIVVNLAIFQTLLLLYLSWLSVINDL